MSRDVVAEMRAIVDEATSHGPYSTPQVATEIVEKLRANDPELLSGWLDAQAEQILRHQINLRDCARRNIHNRRAKVVEFSDAAAARDAGDEAPLRRFLDAPYVVEDGTRKPLSDLTKDDLLFVADGYTARARENHLRASFMTALAKKVKCGTVSDHFTEPQIAAMFDSIAA